MSSRVGSGSICQLPIFGYEQNFHGFPIVDRVMIATLVTVYTKFIRFQATVFEKFAVDHSPILVPFLIYETDTLRLAMLLSPAE